jgi:D-xylose transport system permease protein
MVKILSTLFGNVAEILKHPKIVAFQKKVGVNVRTYTMIIALIGIWLIFAILTEGKFLSARNMSNLFRQMTIISFLAIGMVLVIVTGNIDLSVGSAAGLVSAVVAYCQFSIFPDLLPAIIPGISQPFLGIYSTILSIIVALVVGIIIGMYQGAIVAYLKVPAFIVTLGGLLIFRGGVLQITQGKTIVPIEESLRIIGQEYLPKLEGFIIGLIVAAFIFLGTFWNRKKKKEYGFELKPLIYDLLKALFFSSLVVGYVLIMNSYSGVQIPVLIMAVVALIFSYLSTNTRFGRYAYAIGGNVEATRLSGINIKINIFKVFILMGIMCGIAGIILTAKVGGGTTGGGEGYELSAIAACVIGGTSLMGGEGTILGAIVGSLIMASLNNGMSLMNMAPEWQYYIRGFVLILAVWVDVATRKK